MKITLFSLAWDTHEGTDCRLFGSESEWFDYFSKIISDDIAGVATTEAQEIRIAIEERDIGRAYDLWQASYKAELDTYNWDKYAVTVGSAGEVLGIVSGDALRV